MSIYALKPAFQNLLRPVVKRLYALGVTANQVTVMACVVSVALGIWLYLHADDAVWFWLLPLWLFLRMALNAIDGMLAREFNQKSTLGAYLNEVTDVISDAALIVPFALIAPFSQLGVFCIIWLAALTEYVGVLTQAIGYERGHERSYLGPMGKSDRAFVFGIIAAVYAWFGYLPQWMSMAMWALVVLLVITCIRRVRAGLAE